MLQQNGETGKLFSKSIPVTIKGGYSSQCRNSRLFLTVEWQQSSTAIHRQELKISLTDNDDPFFLYHLYLSDEDFQTLKSNQGLLVDFSAFPQKFIDLIEVCLGEENKVQPKFLLFFTVGENTGSITSASQLDIVETNPFKHLVHLSLKFVVATESIVKQYLATCFKNLKEEKWQLEKRLTFLEQDFKDKLSSCQITLEKKSVELESIRKELNVELSMKESRHARELHDEREKFFTKQKEEELRLDKEWKEKEQNYRKEIQQLEMRTSCLDTLNKELQDQNHKRDGTIRDLRSRILTLEDDNKKHKDAIKDYKAQSEVMQSEIREKRLSISFQKDKIEELEQELNFKKQQVTKLQEQLDLCQRQEKTVHKELDDTKFRYHESKKKCEDLTENVFKGNDVIEKLAREVQVSHEKLKDMALAVANHELRVSEKEKTIQILQKELSDSKFDFKKKNSEIKRLSDSVTSLKGKVSQHEKELKAREEVIRYLNRQLLDQCIVPTYVPPANLSVSSKNIPQTVKEYSSGDPGTSNLNKSPLNLNSEKSKSFPDSMTGDPSHIGNEISSSASVTVDSAHHPSPSINTKKTIKSPDVNSNPPDFQLDSAALNDAFGSNQAMKHSTAKKNTISKNIKKCQKKI